jgi:hypothetical protein
MEEKKMNISIQLLIIKNHLYSPFKIILKFLLIISQIKAILVFQIFQANQKFKII